MMSTCWGPGSAYATADSQSMSTKPRAAGRATQFSVMGTWIGVDHVQDQGATHPGHHHLNERSRVIKSWRSAVISALGFRCWGLPQLHRDQQRTLLPIVALANHCSPRR